jgi:hypothetical protein
MKKINEKQRAVIKFFLKQLSWWEDTSDIDSLTHYSDIGEEIYCLSHLVFDNDYHNYLSAEDLAKIEDAARILYQTIKGIK